MARAAGAKFATGQLVAFIDSDDIAHRDYLKILYENLLTNDVDISVCGFRVFNTISEISNLEQPKPNYSEQVIKDKMGAVRYYLGDITSVPNVHQMTAWGKLYKARIIKATDWKISNYKRHEDNLESIQWYALADKGISVLSTQLYFYRKNPGSITQSLKKNVSPDGIELNYFEFIHELYIKTKSILNDESYDLALINQFANINRAQVQSFFISEQLDKKCIESASENWGEIISLYTEQIQTQKQKVQDLEKTLSLTRNSLSWRITKPIREVKRILKEVFRAIHK